MPSSSQAPARAVRVHTTGEKGMWWTSVREFLKAPAAVASPFPSSIGMAARLLAAVPRHDVRTFVEFGPGTGTFTRYALAHLRPDAMLFAIESEEGLSRHLRESIVDPRLVVIHGSALDVAHHLRRHGLESADCILSGLPFSALSRAERHGLVRQCAALLGTSGLFLAYQVRRTVLPHLRDWFGHVERRFYWRNLPPCHLLTAKGARGQ